MPAARMTDEELQAIESAAAGWAGEFRFMPAWEADRGGPLPNLASFDDGVYFIPDGEEFDPRYPTDDGCTLIVDDLGLDEYARDDNGVMPSLARLLNAPARLLAELRATRAEVESLKRQQEQLARPLTVGTALAAERIVEYQDASGRWWQRRAGGLGRSWFVPVPGDGAAGWTPWTIAHPPKDERRLRCRLVALADVEEAPATRGEVPGG